MEPVIHNLFAGDPGPPGEEAFERLHQARTYRIERIFSHGQASAPGFWYDQSCDEWVALLRGSAVLEFEGGETMVLGPGDYVLIKKHAKHRVEETSADALWLAVHCESIFC